jgi:hypothetical protein
VVTSSPFGINIGGIRGFHGSIVFFFSMCGIGPSDLVSAVLENAIARRLPVITYFRPIFAFLDSLTY